MPNCLVWAACRAGGLFYSGPGNDPTHWGLYAAQLNKILETRELHIGDICKEMQLCPIFRYGDILMNGVPERVEILTFNECRRTLDGETAILIGKDHAACWAHNIWSDVNNHMGTLEEWEAKYGLVSAWVLT